MISNKSAEETISSGDDWLRCKRGPHPNNGRVKEKATEDNLLCLVTTYNPNNPQVFQLVKKTLSMLNQNSSLRSMMSKTKVLHSQRQPRNLKRMLTNSYFFSQKDTDPGVKSCGTKRCGTCPYFKQGKEFTFSTNETFQIKHSMNCTSTNLIYAITCAGCGHNYICICIFFNQILLFDRRKLILNAIFNICVSFKY